MLLPGVQVGCPAFERSPVAPAEARQVGNVRFEVAGGDEEGDGERGHGEMLDACALEHVGGADALGVTVREQALTDLLCIDM